MTYEKRRADVDSRFEKMYVVADERRVHPSPSGRFELTIDTFAEPGSDWHFTRGVLREVVSGQMIVDIRRPDPKFPFAWVVQSRGEFLVCGEDPESYNVIDPVHAVNVCTVPDGSGFNWLTIYPSPDGQVLAVEGCVWGSPNQLVFFDSSDPMRSPLPEITRFKMPTDIQGWVSKTTFRFMRFNPAEHYSEPVSWTASGYYSV